MASFVKFTPINGSYQEFGPVCYLLEIDSAKILLDCGIGGLQYGHDSLSSLDNEYLLTLKKIAKGVDLILISHGDMNHIGGIAAVIKEIGENVPILTTVPTHHMGLMTMYDLMQSVEPYMSESQPLYPFGYDEIDKSFERIQPLRYFQSFHPSDSKLKGVVVTPLPAGHSIGGSMWRIRKLSSEDILYSSHFNHKKEFHLDGAVFEGVARPSLMIVDAKQALVPHFNRKERDAAFFSTVNAALKSDGSVLLPVDSSLRILEMAYLIESNWSEIKPRDTRAFLLTHQSYRTIEFAKGMLEWMGQSIIKIFDADRTNPFEFKHIKLVHSINDLPQNEPIIVLASFPSLDFGFSKELLDRWSRKSSNVILATQPFHPDSFLSKILSESKAGKEFTVTVWEKTELEGEELNRYYRLKKEEKERKAAEAAFAAFEKKRREKDLVLDSMMMEMTDDGDSKKMIVDDLDEDENVSALIEGQIDSVAAFKNIYWIDYKNDWIVKGNDQVFQMLTTQPELFSDLLEESIMGSAKLRLQAYPVRETIKQVDEYGECVDSSEFSPKDEPMVSGEISEKTSQPAKPISATENSIEEVPFKWTRKSVKLVLKCSRKLLTGFEGLSDGRSVKTIITRLNPRKLILVGGNTDATNYIYNHYKLASENALQVFAPKVLESVNASSSINLLVGSISEPLLKDLHVSFYNSFEISLLQAKIKLLSSNLESEKTPEVQKEGSSTQIYQLLPPVEHAVAPCPKIVIGDLKLSELRRYLAAKYRNISAEFSSSGDLICNGKVVIRRDLSSGNFTLEGPLCTEYYQLRNALYENVSMV